MFKIYLLDSRNYPAVLYDDLHIFEPAVLEPELEMNGDNGILIGKLAFKLHDPSLSPQLRLLQNTVIVTQMIGGVETVIFRGRPLLRDDDDYNDQDYTFEGILAGLNDTLQTPSTDKGIGFTSHLAIILNRHNYLASSYSYGNKNRMVDYSKIDRHFESSYMHTIEGDPFSESLAYKANIDPVALDYVRTRASTMDHLKTQFIDSWGGYFYLENEPLTYDSDGCIVLHNYLNYVDIYSPDQVHINAQRIEFGKNLISIRRSVSADDFATVLIPLGKQLTDIEKAWPYYQSVENNKVRKIVSSPDDAVLENYNSTNAYINSETAAVTTGGGSSYVILNDVEVEPGDVFYLTTYLEGFSTDISAASYAILSRDATKVFSIGSSVRNSKDSGGTVTVKNLVLKDERIEIPTPEDTSVLLKLRMAYMISANDPNGGFVLKKFNPQYQEDNVTIMSVSPVATGTIRKRGQFDVGRDVFPDATEDAEAPELYEQSKRVYNNDLYEIFGSIEKVIEFSDYGIDHLNTIYSKAAMMLEKMGEDLEIEIQAADLSYIDETQEPFQPYDLVPVYSEPHGIDMMLPIVKMTLLLADPAAATYTLQNDIHLSEDSKKYISQMVSSPGAGTQKNQTVVIYNGGGSGGGSGEQGPPGPAGYSPTVAVTAITGGHTVTITDTNGDHPFNVMDGEDGQDGADGVSPTVTVTPITGGNRITITDKDHPGGISFNVMDGEDGDPSDLKHTVTIQKYNRSWRLLSDDVTMTWADLWDEQTDDITLITIDGTEVRHLHKTSVEFTSGSTVDSVDIYFSNQRYNGRTAEGKVFKLTVPSDGSTGTITEITGSDIPTSGGSGSAPYEIPITYTDMWRTTRSSDEIYAHYDNCVLNVDGTILDVISAERYVDDGDQFVRIVAVEYESLDQLSYEFATWELIAENNEAYTPIITKREYDSIDSVHHKVFYYNETTGAITKAEGGAATGADISAYLLTQYSVYIIGSVMVDGELHYTYYEPRYETIVGSTSSGYIEFYRATETGIEILTIAARNSIATKSTIPHIFDVLLTLDSNRRVMNGDSTITGEEIRALVNSGKTVSLWDAAHNRMFQYIGVGPSTRPTFVSVWGDTQYKIAVYANSSSTDETTSSLPLLPVPTHSDVGKALVVAESNNEQFYVLQTLPNITNALIYDTQDLTDQQLFQSHQNLHLYGSAVGFVYNGSTINAIGKSTGAHTAKMIVDDYFGSNTTLIDKAFLYVIDQNGNVYDLDSVDITNNIVVFKRRSGNTDYFLTLTGTSTTVATSSSPIGGSATPFLISLSYNSSTDTWTCNKTAAEILVNMGNSMVYYQGYRYYVTSMFNTGGNSATIYYERQEVGSSNGIEEFKFTIQNDSVTIKRYTTPLNLFEIPIVYSNNAWDIDGTKIIAGTIYDQYKHCVLVTENKRIHIVKSFRSEDPQDKYVELIGVEPASDGSDLTIWKLIAEANSSQHASITTYTFSGGSFGGNVFYYIDGTNIKNAETNLVVTGQDIYNQTIAQGLAPVLYESGTGYFETTQYHFYRYGSFGMYFRRLDGAFEVSIHWSNQTFIKTEGGYNTPFKISAVWNSSQNKYVLNALVDGAWTTASFNDIYNHAEGLLLNANLPVDKIYRSPPYWISTYFYDIQPTSSGFSIIEWNIEADDTDTITVTRNVINNIQRTVYYAVTLNANGTVNTKDSSLSWSTVSGRMSNPAFADYLLVTWGNSLFTAKAIEKLSNDDIKFIGNVEHDGIQRYMVFTLNSNDILTTTVIETYSRRPVVVWEVQDATQGLSALNTNITANLAWQLTNLDLTPFKRIKIYSRAGRKTGAIAADSSITPASIIEMSLDDRAKETVSQNVFIGSSIVQNPNDANRLGILTCAVSSDKTKFAVVRATTLYGTAATSNTDAYPNVFMIEGYYD